MQSAYQLVMLFTLFFNPAMYVLVVLNWLFRLLLLHPLTSTLPFLFSHNISPSLFFRRPSSSTAVSLFPHTILFAAIPLTLPKPQV